MDVIDALEITSPATYRETWRKYNLRHHREAPHSDQVVPIPARVGKRLGRGARLVVSRR